MKCIQFFSIAITGVIFLSCHQEDLTKNEIEIILPETEDCLNEIVNRIKSIEVIDLQIDNNSMYNEDAQLRVSDNYYYFISNDMQLMCYEKATGKLLFSRNIKGRARSECIYVSNWFVKDDIIVINDRGILKMYDHTGQFCGVLGETKSNYLLPIGDGYVDFIADGIGNDGKCLVLLDSSFNEKESYFEIPEEYITGSFVRLSNTSPDKYVFKDTLRFLYQYTFRLHFFPGNKTYHFITSHPIPESLLSNPNGEFKSIEIDCLNNDYANRLEDLAENQDYIAFKYYIGSDINFVLLSKRDNKVFGTRYENEDETNSPNTMRKSLLLWTNIIYSDGKYFYMRVGMDLYQYWNEHKEMLDSCLRPVYDTMQARLARSEHNDFNFYYKIEF